MDRRLILAVVAAMVMGGGLVTATSAAATTTSYPCASTATIKSVRDLTAGHTGYLMVFGAETPKGARFHGTTLRRAHFYELHGVAITLSFGHTTYRLDRNAIIMLSCSGTSVGTAAKYPMLRMLRGRAQVSDPASWYGSLSTEEGLYNPVIGDGRAMAFTVARTLRQTTALTLVQKMRWYLSMVDQPTGTTTAATGGAPRINVTPYVGPAPGKCRHCHDATLTTTTSYGHGTASYA